MNIMNLCKSEDLQDISCLWVTERCSGVSSTPSSLNGVVVIKVQPILLQRVTVQNSISCFCGNYYAIVKFGLAQCLLIM